MIRSLTKKLLKSAHLLKDELVLCLQEMIEGNLILQLVNNCLNFLLENGGVDDLDSEDWVNMIDRGGLIHISDSLYMVFYSLELQFRHHFTTTKETGTILQKILQDDDLLFYWSLVSVNWDVEADELLRLIAEHWITIRGFSAASAFMEKYKQANKKTIEKSKGLRKNMISSTNTVQDI